MHLLRIYRVKTTRRKSKRKREDNFPEEVQREKKRVWWTDMQTGDQMRTKRRGNGRRRRRRGWKRTPVAPAVAPTVPQELSQEFKKNWPTVAPQSAHSWPKAAPIQEHPHVHNTWRTHLLPYCLQPRVMHFLYHVLGQLQMISRLFMRSLVNSCRQKRHRGAGGGGSQARQKAFQ